MKTREGIRPRRANAVEANRLIPIMWPPKMDVQEPREQEERDTGKRRMGGSQSRQMTVPLGPVALVLRSSKSDLQKPVKRQNQQVTRKELEINRTCA